MDNEYAGQLILMLEEGFRRIAGEIDKVARAIESQTETIELMRQEMWDIPRAIRGQEEQPPG